MVVTALWVLEIEHVSDAWAAGVLANGPALHLYLFYFVCGVKSSSFYILKGTTMCFCVPVVSTSALWDPPD